MGQDSQDDEDGGAVQISLGFNNTGSPQRAGEHGEILVEESLENSPIKLNRTSEVETTLDGTGRAGDDRDQNNIYGNEIEE